MKTLKGFDVVALAYLGILTLLVLVFRPPGTLLYLLGHAAAAGVVLGAAAGHARWGGRLWTVARYWYVVPFVLVAFRELHYLIPEVHNFDDHRWDRILADVDRRWFGDVDGFFLGLLTPGAADVLHVCYWSYYVSLAVLDGALFGGWMHRAITALELRMPDAFPSGHTLMSLVLMFLAKRHGSWKTFWIVAPPAVGCILATMALRYHYAVDVVASFALFPGALWLGLGANKLTRSER